MNNTFSIDSIKDEVETLRKVVIFIISSFLSSIVLPLEPSVTYSPSVSETRGARGLKRTTVNMTMHSASLDLSSIPGEARLSTRLAGDPGRDPGMAGSGLWEGLLYGGLREPVSED